MLHRLSSATDWHSIAQMTLDLQGHALKRSSIYGHLPVLAFEGHRSDRDTSLLPICRKVVPLPTVLFAVDNALKGFIAPLEYTVV